MKILACTDIHSNKYYIEKLKKKAKKADFIICAGDLTIFEQFLNKVLEDLNLIGKKVFLIHGNHEGEVIVRELCKKFENLEFIHKKKIEYEGFTIIGHGGGGFSERDLDFEKWTENMKIKGSQTIFIHHSPPYNTRLDYITNMHTGSKSYREFIEKYKPLLSISGHIHETFGLQEKLYNETIILNPGPEGMLIEIEINKKLKSKNKNS